MKRLVMCSKFRLDGLEIGFHVPTIPNSRVITTLGRQGDLVFRNQTISKNHAAFEFYPQTNEIVLCVQSTNYSGVKVQMLGSSEAMTGDCPLVYGTQYAIHIGPCIFALHWNSYGPDAAVALEKSTGAGYLKAMGRAHRLNTFNRPTVINTSEHRLMHPPLPIIKSTVCELKHLRRTLGYGAFGSVYMTVDAVSRQFVATHVIDFLGYNTQDTTNIRIYMPLRRGTLMDFVAKETHTPKLLQKYMLPQMLSALAWLSFNNMCHRDVKPQNILYDRTPGSSPFLFQLANLGSAFPAGISRGMCGTEGYMAPEVVRDGIHTPKMDVWSMFITLVDVHDPEQSASLTQVSMIEFARRGRMLFPGLSDMGHEDPDCRASADQILIRNFNGWGLPDTQTVVQPSVVGSEPS
ncbi:kinase-like domain-containing protein [Ilyonectria destructans]|nr:kinase-like domain-containing protein [Ilyonectria destructans]